MKGFLVICFAFVTLHGVAQNELAEDSTATPAITAVGKSVGKKTAVIIGKEGGSVESSDGLATLIIPEGAVNKKTTFVIEPISNEIPNGNGNAYRLEPSGIKFKKPVTLMLKYGDEETKDSIPLLMGIAIQDEKGQWMGLNKFIVDTAARTLSGMINHFSDWSKFDIIKIDPSYRRVQVDNTITVYVTGVQPGPECDDRLEVCPLTKQPKKVIWRVNDLEGGNTEIGRINGRMQGAYYTAPTTVPDHNPVAVTADLVGLTFKVNGKNLKDLRLYCSVLIYDNAYEVKMISWQEVGIATYIDSGSFVISIEGKTGKIIEKVNNNTTDKLEYHSLTECTYKIINPGANHGLIHITGVRQIKLTPANPPDYPTVEISFIPKPIVYSTFRFTCKDEKGKLFVKTTEIATGVVGRSTAQPLFVKFTARSGEQKILDMPIPGGYYRVTVKKLTDD